MGNVCQGEEIDFKDLRTDEQKKIMSLLGGMIAGNINRGATQLQQPRTAPPDMGQMAAMNTMLGVGGYGGYQYNPYPYGMQPPIGMAPPYDFGGGGGGGGGGYPWDEEGSGWNPWKPPTDDSGNTRPPARPPGRIGPWFPEA